MQRWHPYSHFSFKQHIELSSNLSEPAKGLPLLKSKVFKVSNDLGQLIFLDFPFLKEIHLAQDRSDF